MITNSSLLPNPEVRRALGRADWVSVKVDAARESVWKRVDRPSRRLDFAALLDGLRTFAREYTGTLVTETMLVAGVNDAEPHLHELADLIAGLGADASYLAIPTRPPAEPWVQAPDEEVVTRAYGILAGRVPGVEYLTGYEGDAFASTGDARADLLSITAVHPMRREAVTALLERDGADWRTVDDLLAELLLAETSYEGYTYYVRRFTRIPRRGRTRSFRLVPHPTRVARARRRGARCTAHRRELPRLGRGPHRHRIDRRGRRELDRATFHAATACFAIAAPGHSWAIVATAGMSIGHKGMMHAAKTMAATAYDLYTKPELLAEARAEHARATKRSPYRSPDSRRGVRPTGREPG